MRKSTAPFVAHRLVAHRLVADGRGVPTVRLIAKGDAEAFPDRWIAARDVFGVVTSRPPLTTAASITAAWTTPPARSSPCLAGGAAATARVGRRLAARAPRPGGRPLLSTLLILSRVPTRLITALMPWLDQETRAEGR